MFLRMNPSQTGYTRDGKQKAGGPFLMLFSRETGGEIRACVRSVKLRQCGHVAPLRFRSPPVFDLRPAAVRSWMIGHVTLAGVRVFLNGTYGHDGLPMDCGEKPFPWAEPVHPERAPLWEKLTPVPAEMAHSFWRDVTGGSGATLRQWAIANERELRKLKAGRAASEVAS